MKYRDFCFQNTNLSLNCKFFNWSPEISVHQNLQETFKGSPWDFGFQLGCFCDYIQIPTDIIFLRIVRTTYHPSFLMEKNFRVKTSRSRKTCRTSVELFSVYPLELQRKPSAIPVAIKFERWMSAMSNELTHRETIINL